MYVPGTRGDEVTVCRRRECLLLSPRHGWAFLLPSWQRSFANLPFVHGAVWFSSGREARKSNV